MKTKINKKITRGIYGSREKIINQEKNPTSIVSKKNILLLFSKSNNTK